MSPTRSCRDQALCACCAFRRSSGCGSSPRRNSKPPGLARRRPSRRSTTRSSGAISSCRARQRHQHRRRNAQEVIAPRLGWRLPRVFAHRCGGALAPENTLAGLRIAARLGLRAVEFDVMLSADASPWLLHDETLERTTNGSGPDVRDARCRTVRPRRRCSPAPGICRRAAADAGVRQRTPVGNWVCSANVEIKPAAGFEALTGEVVARAGAHPVGGRGTCR
jgi:hypothetical protein